MARYSVDTYVSKVRRVTAIDALNRMPDDELIGKLESAMFPEIEPFTDPRVFEPDEPESAGLAPAIRRLLHQDLDVMYRGNDDPHCGTYIGWGLQDGMSALSMIWEPDDDDFDDWCNPVQRLRSAGICELPTAVEVIPVEPIIEVDGSRYTTGTTTGTYRFMIPTEPLREAGRTSPDRAF